MKKIISTHKNESDNRAGSIILVFIDTLIIYIVAHLWYDFYFSHESMSLLYVLAICILTMSIVIISYINGAYQYWLTAPLSREIRAVLTAWIIAIALLTFLGFIFKANHSFSRIWFSATIVSAIILVIFTRILFRFMLLKIKGSDWNKINIVIIGCNDHGFRVLNKIKASYRSNLIIKGFFDNRYKNLTDIEKKSQPELIGAIDDLKAYLDTHGFKKNNLTDNTHIHQIWITLPYTHTEKDILLEMLDKYSVDIIHVPEPYFPANVQQEFKLISGIPVITTSITALGTRQKLLKLAEDYIFSLIILILVSPILLIISIGIKLSSPGPIIFRQKRVSTNGQIFDILKFRTMPVNVEAKTGPAWAKAGENRATRFGSFLRSTSLDELPQFVNVLKGEMSIVGPRPERPEFVNQFKNDIPSYMKKHLLKAGITGWAQVNGFRGDTSLKKRIEHDLYYISNWSILFDFKIIFQTIYKGFVSKTAY